MYAVSLHTIATQRAPDRCADLRMPERVSIVHDIEDALLAFFLQVARKEGALLTLMRQTPGFSFQRDRWCFTLPGLYMFLRRHYDEFRDIDYRKFRQYLFGCPVNRRISPFEAEIRIEDKQANVDGTTYAMVWSPSLPGGNEDPPGCPGRRRRP